jgi:hypothetical protein
MARHGIQNQPVVEGHVPSRALARFRVVERNRDGLAELAHAGEERLRVLRSERNLRVAVW